MPEIRAEVSRSLLARLARRVPRTWRIWAVAVPIFVIVALPLGYEVGIRLVTPDAVRATASSYPDGHVRVSHEITDWHVVNDLYTRINSLPLAPLGTYHCPLPGPNTYDFTFTRWGTVIEEAAPGPGCIGLWSVSRGGIGWSRLDSDGETVAILAEARLPLSS